MPELPEVEVLVRHLAPLLEGRMVRGVEVRRERVLRPTSPSELDAALVGARFVRVTRRAKFLVFELRRPRIGPLTLVGHLGMTGRMFLQPKRAPLPRHTAVALELCRGRFVFEDTRYFGRLTLDTAPLAALGPEPLNGEFTVERFAADLRRSTQAIKVKLLDQSLVAGVGNIYASEALFLAGISPRRSARSLTLSEARRLHSAIRRVLREAIRFGSTLPLDFAGKLGGDGLFYYGGGEELAPGYEERLRVYDRAGQPCRRCRASIRRLVQAARSTYYCPRCQC
jgi:formamidopyrimidine-DNA glycosylase